jgi:hypothetical protein
LGAGIASGPSNDSTACIRPVAASSGTKKLGRMTAWQQRGGFCDGTKKQAGLAGVGERLSPLHRYEKSHPILIQFIDIEQSNDAIIYPA